ncbi:LHFPL tetraspan subfamily member 6 protein-like [Apostichopus japonicus]|uniref:LHFPL tetraspan subfamily member 6 protein-like n=1 Tax=Stichopus japonicus TaxID=307972 RepID=UPI003AB6F4C9
MNGTRYSQVPPRSPTRVPHYPMSVRALEPGTYIKRSTQTLASARSGHLYHSRSCNLSVYSQQNVDFRMSCGLTAIGVIWAVVSILGTAASCVGFFLPYWLEGTLGNTSHPVHFGVFRRCNYFMNNEVVLKCGHYTTFSDIPTMTWKICTVVIGLGCVTSLFVSFCGLLACCVRDFVTRRVGRVCGVLQFIAAILIGTGMALYPQGWSHEHVREACGPDSQPYNPGSCTIGWTFYLTAGGCGTLMIATLLSWHAGTKTVSYDD